jgi:hypothetical protein
MEKGFTDYAEPQPNQLVHRLRRLRRTATQIKEIITLVRRLHRFPQIKEDVVYREICDNQRNLWTRGFYNPCNL